MQQQNTYLEELVTGFIAKIAEKSIDRVIHCRPFDSTSSESEGISDGSSTVPAQDNLTQSEDMLEG
jgi:actin-like ATPase involved in cell morphogenesis